MTTRRARRLIPWKAEPMKLWEHFVFTAMYAFLVVGYIWIAG